jgi:hypothetical protein
MQLRASGRMGPGHEARDDAGFAARHSLTLDLAVHVRLPCRKRGEVKVAPGAGPHWLMLSRSL